MVMRGRERLEGVRGYHTQIIIKNMKEKKRFYKKRQFRLSDENYLWLTNIKKGTWNHTFNNLRKGNGEKEENTNTESLQTL